MIIRQSEPSAPKRDYPVFLVKGDGNPLDVDVSTGGASPATIKVFKRGGAGFVAAAGAVLTKDDPAVDGSYTLTWAGPNLDTVGVVKTRIEHASIRGGVYQFEVEVEPLTADGRLRYNIAQGGAAGYITLDAGASATDNYYAGGGRNCLAIIVEGTGAGEMRLANGYTGATKQLAVTPNWQTPPDATSVYELIPFTGQLDAATITAIQAGLASAAAVASVQTDTTRIIGLLQDNSMMDQITWGSNNVVTLARVRVFASAAALAAATPGNANGADGEIQRYTVTSVDIGSGQFSSFKKSRTL